MVRPRRLSEFEAMACAAAEDNGDGTGGYILRDDASAVAAWTLAFGGDVLNEDGTGYVYDGDATKEAMAMLQADVRQRLRLLLHRGLPEPRVRGPPRDLRAGLDVGHRLLRGRSGSGRQHG